MKALHLFGCLGDDVGDPKLLSEEVSHVGFDHLCCTSIEADVQLVVKGLGPVRLN